MVLCYYTYAGYCTLEVVLFVSIHPCSNGESCEQRRGSARWTSKGLYLLCYEQITSSVVSYSILITQYHASRFHFSQTYHVGEKHLPLHNLCSVKPEHDLRFDCARLYSKTE
jgi:hypothetical protein